MRTRSGNATRIWGAWAGAIVATAIGCSSESDGADATDSNGGASSGGSSASGGSGSGTGGGSSTPGNAPSIDGCSIFPDDNAWNQDVSGLPVHPRSDAIVDSLGRDENVHPDFGTVWDGAPIGIPFVLVDGSQEGVTIDYVAYGDESDPGPFPIPLDAPIEGGPDSDGDRHVIALDTENCRLYELYRGFPQSDAWNADSGVEWDLSTNDSHPAGCTSADAAGLPIFPGLVRYEEVVEEGEIRHAIRFTVERSRRAYVAPATHYASDDTDESLPAMGERFRMKANYDCSSFSTEAQVVCTALKKHGLIVADNGSNWYLSGAPDPRWDDDALGDLKQIEGDAFEVVDTGATVVTDAPDCEF